MPYAGLQVAPPGDSRRLPRQPAKLPDREFLAEQPRVILPLDNDQSVAGRVLGRDEPRRLEAVAPPADLQSLALAEGIERQPDVLTELLTGSPSRYTRNAPDLPMRYRRPS